MDLIYSNAACLPARRQRPNAASTIFAYERAVFEFESFDWSPSRAAYAWLVYTRWRNLLDPFDETWMKWCFWTINCFINTFFLFRRTDCSVLCLFIFVLWLYKLEAHSLFSKRPLVYGKLLSAYYVLCAVDHGEQRSQHELHFVDRRSGISLRINRFLCHYLL